MKFNAKQIDNIARFLGTISASSAIGAAIGLYRPNQVNAVEEISMTITAAITLFAMVYILKGQK
ncbi:MAG: hypothetical protein RL018_450 [Pseudomonadota bacterium]|jgi:hypothetical protein